MIFITELNWGIFEVISLLTICIAGFFTTIIIIPYVIGLMKRKGYIGNDIHKNSKPEVPESGGLSIVIGISLTSLLLMIFFHNLYNELLIYFLTILISGLIGFIDDRIKLKSFYKIVLTILTGTAIFLANYIGFISIKSPTLPFLGVTRLTMIYPLAAPLIVAVFANASNMLEGYNGEGSGTSLIALFFLFICGLIWNSSIVILITSTSIAVIIAFFIYNKFPAKIFPGDIGTLSIGSIFACIALLGSMEVAVFCALLIHIFNSFFVISSVRGFFESSEIQDQKSDIILLDNDIIIASEKRTSALTLPRLILAKGPLKEPDLVKNFYVISIICGFFSIISILLTQWTLGNLNFFYVYLFIFIFLIPTTILLYYYPRIRGIISLMIILLIVIILLLILIDSVIMKIFYEEIDLIFIRIPTNILFSLILIAPILIIWYFLTIKYFWSQIKKLKKLNT
ncbi:MAG: hypothetical protein ACFFD5_01220 [Candidatus Thorarchaeota archaeon]